MKISLNTIKQLTDINLTVDELVEKINMQLGQVEGVENLAEKYKDVVIVKVVECEKHPNADKLSICQIDAGDRYKELRAQNSELIQVVCGAPNARAGMFAAWLPPNTTVPASFSEEKPFVLDAREIRGEMSQGMLASADELDLGSDHSGIIEIDPDEKTPYSVTIEPGASFSEVFGLDDTVIELENKMFTHRPDCFGQLGVARELAGIQQDVFNNPAWYYEILPDTSSSKDSLPLIVFNEAGDAVPRFMTVTMDRVDVKPSPLWLQAKLIALGSKPVNNVVDVTNYMMLMSAQPLHAYDYDKLSQHTLGVRLAKKDETVTLLNNKTYEIEPSDIVIVDGERVVGLGGVMGSSSSEVSESTKRIVIECATFDMYAIRKTSMKHGIFTDAVTRFNKGQSMLMNPYVLQETVRLMSELSGAIQVGRPTDDLLRDEKQWRTNPAVKPMLAPKIITSNFINNRLGLNLSAGSIMKLLENVGFECEAKGDNEFSYWSPAWRMDIQDPEDIVEEVGRLYGFDKLPRELPRRGIEPAPKNSIFTIKQRVRDLLSKAGANELLTYSFVHEQIFKKADQDWEQAFRLSNALSPDLQYYRLTVLPSLLDKVHGNIKAGHDEFVLFEIGKGHNKKYHAADDDGLPGELEFVDAVYASKTAQKGAAYFRIRRLLEQLADDLHIQLVFKSIVEELDYPVTAPFDQSRSALVEASTGEFIGMIGELKRTVIDNFKLPSYVSAMTLDLLGLEKAAEVAKHRYTPLSRYPSISQDISLKVSSSVSYVDIVSSVEKTLTEFLRGEDIFWQITPVSIYRSEKDANHTTTTLHIVYTSHKATLNVKSINKIMDEVAEAALRDIGAERI